MEEIKDLTGGGATMSLETAGATSAWQDALGAVRPWGTVCLVGLGGGDFSFSLGQVLRRQLKVLTSWTMSLQGQKACADFVVERGVDLDSQFTHTWRLDQAEEAYETFNRQSGGKGVFLF